MKATSTMRSKDPEAERERMEILINKVKASCEQPDISSNKELKDLFGQTHNTMQAIDKGQVRKRGSWLQFKGITNSFCELYFPAQVQKPLYPVSRVVTMPV